MGRAEDRDNSGINYLHDNASGKECIWNCSVRRVDVNRDLASEWKYGMLVVPSTVCYGQDGYYPRQRNILLSVVLLLYQQVTSASSTG
jgi:hypothetical protein